MYRFKANAMDSGIYECRAINNGGNISQELVLLVYGIYSYTCI